MAVRFKFRSSVAFDSADLGGRPSISVRDLRTKIVEQKNLQICRDFDLVISDADTGRALDDEEFQIPEGSSVIIKRVPTGRSVPSDLGAVGSSADKHAGFLDTLASSPSENLDMENFDDFGIDLYPTLEASLSESDADVGDVNSSANRKNKIVPRSSETSISKCQNFDRSDISEALSKGEGIREKLEKECNAEDNQKQTKLNQNKEEHKNLDKVIGMSTPTTLNVDLPTELRCSLCNTIFKDAVMIPCCQHSFCDKCIRLALVERARCPKCSSLKCTIEDLLPNLSLRQAIEHFLEAQVGFNATDNIIPKFVPDGESGIQAKEVSCAVSVRQIDPSFPHSPSATGKGSNQVMIESAYESKRTAGIGSHRIRLDTDKSVKSAPSSLKIHQSKRNENTSAEARRQMADFQAGGHSSILSDNLLQNEEAALTIQKKKGPGVNPPDGSGVLLPPFKHRKGDRTCYMCGSPNHLIRDCPAASNSYPQAGDAAFPGGMSTYGQPYWHGATFPHARPYANIYGTPGVMPYDPTIVPLTPFGVPSYMPPLYAGMPVPYGFMRMGGMQPSMMGERPLTRAEFMDLQEGARKHELLNDHPDRVDYDNTSDDYHYNGTQRRHERRHHVDKETTRSCSDNDSQRIHRKHSHDKHEKRPGFTSDEEIHSFDWKHETRTHVSVSGRDQRAHHSEKSNSEVSDSSDRRSRERKKYHHKSGSKKLNERRGQSGSDCSRRSYHQRRKEKSVDIEKVVKDHKRQSSKHHSHSESGFEPDSSSDRKQLCKEKEASHSLRHSKQKVMSTDDQLKEDRWEMIDGLDKGYREAYHYRKHKRTR